MPIVVFQQQINAYTSGARKSCPEIDNKILYSAAQNGVTTSSMYHQINRFPTKSKLVTFPCLVISRLASHSAALCLAGPCSWHVV